MEEDYDPMDTCPYDPAHRVSRSKMPFHLTRCAKNHTDKKKKLCPYDSRHVLEPRDYDNHLKTCPQREAAVRYKLREPEAPIKDDYILPIMAAPLPVAVEEYGAWENEIQDQSYNPLAHIEKKPVVQCLIGASKAKRKKFRMEERRRIAALEQAAAKENESIPTTWTQSREQYSDFAFQPAVNSWDVTERKGSVSSEDDAPLRLPKTQPFNSFPIPTPTPQADEWVDEPKVAEKETLSSFAKEFVPNCLKKDEIVYNEYVAAMQKPRQASVERSRSISTSDRAPTQPQPVVVAKVEKPKPEVPVWPIVKKTNSSTSIDPKTAVDDLPMNKLAISTKEEVPVKPIEKSIPNIAWIEPKAVVTNVNSYQPVRPTKQNLPEWPSKKTLFDILTEPNYPTNHVDTPVPKQEAPSAWSTKRTLASTVSAPKPAKPEIPKQEVTQEDNTAVLRRKESALREAYEPKASAWAQQPHKQQEVAAKPPVPQWPREKTISTASSVQSDYESCDGYEKPAVKQVNDVPSWPAKKSLASIIAEPKSQASCNEDVPGWRSRNSNSATSYDSDVEYDNAKRETAAAKQDVPTWPAKKTTAIESKWSTKSEPYVPEELPRAESVLSCYSQQSSGATSYYSALEDDSSNARREIAAKADVPVWPMRRAATSEMEIAGKDEAYIPEKLSKSNEPEYNRPILRRPMIRDLSPWSSKESLASSSADTRSTFSEKPKYPEKSLYTVPARRAVDPPTPTSEQPSTARDKYTRKLYCPPARRQVEPPASPTVLSEQPYTAQNKSSTPRLLTSQQIRNINANLLQKPRASEFSYAAAAEKKEEPSAIGFRCNTYAKLVSCTDNEKENAAKLADTRSNPTNSYESRMVSLHQNFKRINANEAAGRILSWNY